MSLARSPYALTGGLAVALAISGCGLFRQVRAAESSLRAEKERKPAPELALKDADGKTVRLSDYKGKVVLLNFWATWCGPCRMEMPWFIDFERKYKDKGFAVVGIAMDEEGWQVVKPFITDLAVNYRILLGTTSAADLYGGVDALPTTFLIDQEGRVAATHVGLAGRDTFENGIKELLSGPSAGSGNPAVLARAR
ncbi:MAG: TlpA family protein disulfide reductase [Acidobacteria bacterium]|nr:TlpA family protein disulfide reductase [Acidobacteriota bacterium]